MSSTASMIALTRQKALDMALDHKAITIAQELGTTKEKKHGAYHVYDDKHLGIRWDDYGNNLEVHYEGEVKLSTQLGELNKAILQSEWIGHLFRVWTEAEKKQVLKEIERKRKEEERKQADYQDDLPEDFIERISNTQTIPPKVMELTPEARKEVEKYVKDAPWTKKQNRVLAHETEDELHNHLLDDGWKVTAADVHWTQYRKDNLTLTIEEETQ